MTIARRLARLEGTAAAKARRRGADAHPVIFLPERGAPDLDMRIAIFSNGQEMHRDHGETDAAFKSRVSEGFQCA